MNFVKPERRVHSVFVHCSASEMNLAGKALVSEIRRWHLARKFNDIGYHFIIDKLGAVLEGRPLDRPPAAQRGFNQRTIAICTHGLTFGSDWYAGKQAGAVRELCEQINSAYDGLISFKPHNLVNSNKTCPVFSIKRLLKIDRWRRMA